MSKVKPESSCKDCEKRHSGCHSECEEYKEFQEKLMEYREIKNKEKIKMEMSKAYIRTSIRNMKKRRK